MRKWLIAIDLDGTLLANKITEKPEYISERTFLTIKKLMEKGHKIAITTGRPWTNTKHIYKQIGLNTIVCNYDGTHIHKPYDSGFLPLWTSINRKIIFEILNKKNIKKNLANFLIKCDKQTYLLNIEDQLLFNSFHLSKKSTKKWKKKNIYLRKDPQIVVLVLNGSENSSKEIIQNLKKQYRNALSFINWFFEEKNETYVLITQKKASKGTAMSFIASYYNIPMTRTLAFGDDENDISLLKMAKIGVAMKNAKPIVKKYANKVSEYTNEEDAVAKYLEKFFHLQ